MYNAILDFVNIFLFLFFRGLLIVVESSLISKSPLYNISNSYYSNTLLALLEHEKFVLLHEFFSILPKLMYEKSCTIV
jgi:hypothetical protein